MYHDNFEADARILPAVRKSIDWMWNTQWLGADGAFKYVSLSCPAEGGPDLNHIIGHACGWVYYNESYSSSFQYLSFRR